MPLALGMFSLRLWNILPSKSIFVYHIRESNGVIDGRDFGHKVSAQPPKGVENKINHTDGQLCLCDPRKPVDTEACVNFSG